MKKTTVISLVLVLLSLFGLMTACSGGSDADKAYTAWTKNTAPKVEQADAAMKEALNTAADDQAKLSILDEYLSVLKPAVDELYGIDVTKLTGKFKEEAPAQIEAMKTVLAQYEVMRDNLAEQISGGQAAPAEGEAPVANDEAPVANDEGGSVEEDAGEEE